MYFVISGYIENSTFECDDIENLEEDNTEEDDTEQEN